MFEMKMQSKIKRDGREKRGEDKGQSEKRGEELGQRKEKQYHDEETPEPGK